MIMLMVFAAGSLSGHWPRRSVEVLHTSTEEGDAEFGVSQRIANWCTERNEFEIYRVA